MKTFCLLLLSVAFQLVAAEEKTVEKQALPENAVLIIVKPQKSELARGEEIDVEVFVQNRTSEPIAIPPIDSKDDYSSTVVDFDVRTFKVEGDQLESISAEVSSSGLTCLSNQFLDARMSKRLRFRWKCPDEDFDLLSLKIQFFIEGAFRSGQTTITQMNANKAEMATPSKPSN